MTQCEKRVDGKLSKEILAFCKHLAGSCNVTAICLCGDYTEGSGSNETLEVLLVIRDFPQRLINFVKVLENRNVFISAVDEWVFERDVDRGFLGEALAGRMIFSYIPLLNGDYLHVSEIKLKKRLIRELLENLVLDFPELSYEIHIKPEYFLYEAMMRRARVFPLATYFVSNFMREDCKERNIERSLAGYMKALRELENDGLIKFVNDYVKISENFARNVKGAKARFTNLFKTGQRTLFTSFLGFFPQALSILSQNLETLRKLQKLENTKITKTFDAPENYLFVYTENGLVPLASKIDFEAFARKILSAGANKKVEVEEIGGILNDVFLVKAFVKGGEQKIVVKRFKDWSSFKWFPLTLWSVGTRTFTVLGRSRLEKEFAINQLLKSKGFAVPKLLYVSASERLIFMEYVEGENLSKIVKKAASSKIASESRKALELLEKVGELFAQVHAAGVALGDTKPENFVVRKNSKIVLLDLEQASRRGDKVWDVAEFLYYAGHDVPLFADAHRAELIAKAFITGYLRAGGDVKIVKKAGTPKYTKVFSVFTLPHIMLAYSNLCRKADQT